MKKYLFTILTALTALTLGSCSSDDAITDGGAAAKQKLTFTASHNSDASSRSMLNPDNYKQVWFKSTDEFSLFSFDDNDQAVNNNLKLENTTDENGGYAVLVGEGQQTGTRHFVVYPYNSSMTISAGGLEGTKKVSGLMLPLEQTAVAGSFADGANVAWAYSTTSNLTFHTACAIAKVKVVDDGITKITISANNAIAGALALDNVGATGCNVTPTEAAANKTVTLLPPTGSTTFTNGKTYYICFLGCQLSAGNFTLKANQGTMEVMNKTTSKAYYFAPGKVYDLGDVQSTAIKFLTITVEDWAEGDVNPMK